MDDAGRDAVVAYLAYPVRIGGAPGELLVAEEPLLAGGLTGGQVALVAIGVVHGQWHGGRAGDTRPPVHVDGRSGCLGRDDLFARRDVLLDSRNARDGLGGSGGVFDPIADHLVDAPNVGFVLGIGVRGSTGEDAHGGSFRLSAVIRTARRCRSVFTRAGRAGGWMSDELVEHERERPCVCGRTGSSRSSGAWSRTRR